MSDNEILPPGTILFGYRVLQLVGEGGSTYVYKAQHPELPKFVAIKQLKSEQVGDDVALQRFLREATIMAKLNHPNVVTIYGLKHDTENGLYFIFTEFAEQGTLADRLVESPEGLPVDEVLHIAMGICSGLEAVHRNGVIHRDIKPSNILLSDVGLDRDIPKLSDFGIARSSAIADISPPSSDIYGTLYYMSPEQLSLDLDIDHRSDLYSLGTLLYHVLTGQVPFAGEPEQVFWGHLYLAPKPPSELRSDIPEALEQIILRALQKDCNDRYQSAADMYDALKAIVDVSVRHQRLRRHHAVLEQGLACLEKGDWDAAAEALGQASLLEPGDNRALDGLRRARDQQKLKRLYDLGVQYLESAEWEKAKDLLVQVMSYDPDYAGDQAREQLERATQELERRRARDSLMVQYSTGMGRFRNRRWAQAIAELQQVVVRDPEFADAAQRLAEARRYAEAALLFEQAERHLEREEWEQAVALFEEVESLGPPDIDVTEELNNARSRRLVGREQRELAAWYDEGMAHLNAENLEQAAAVFRRVLERRPSYRDVQNRVKQIEEALRTDRLFEQASECEAAGDWGGAIGVYQEILGLNPLDRKAARRLSRAQRCAAGEHWEGFFAIAVRVQGWWDERGQCTRVVLVWLFAAALLASGVGGALLESRLSLFSPGQTPTILYNGDFERGFKWWQHGGELDQGVECDGGDCYAVLGNPNYPCYDGVPVGEAWMKQTFGVPQVISPTISLRYRVFSYDLDLPDYDYFQVYINGEPFSQRYGNYEWNEPSCDREVWDSGWQTLTLDLSAYRGQEVEVSLRNINETQPYHNTWTYVDDVRLDAVY